MKTRTLSGSPSILTFLLFLGILGNPLPAQGFPRPMPRLHKAGDPDSPGILEPVLSALTGQEVRIPNTDQADGSVLLNMVGDPLVQDARGAASLLGAAITRVESPNKDLRTAVDDLDKAAGAGDTPGMQAAATEALDILLGRTRGRIYDGFGLLNFNRGAYAPDQLPGEYKMKVLTDSGRKSRGIDGVARKIWEVDVNMLWYDGQFDADTFLLRVPVTADPFDTLRIHYRIYSLQREDFSPSAIVSDYRAPGSVQFPLKGFDSVWVPVQGASVTKITVDFPPLRLLRGIYTWGWRVHPPRIHFLQPVFEIVNVNTGQVELEPQGRSFAYRNRMLSLNDIGDAAPEKKIYEVAQAVLAGATPAQVVSMLENPDVFPRGTWPEWADLNDDQRQLPAEAWDVLAAEGIPQGQFGPYRFVSVYLNNEMYGAGPLGNKIQPWVQGDRFQVKVINLDRHTHYFRNVDFGTRLHDDMRAGGFPAASHSFEIMSVKPIFGAPKVAEVQWRAGWGFRPHLDVLQQSGVFPQASDKVFLKSYFDGQGRRRRGWQYSADLRGGDLVFDPPEFVIGTPSDPSPGHLEEGDHAHGLVIGRHTPGYGIAKMCSHADHPYPGFCETDISAFNPHGVKNVDLDGDGINDVLWFPSFLRNPDPDGGDVISPTPAWKPFLWINPANGTLFLDPADPSKGFWADLTYAHGAPVPAGGDLSATIEEPRSAGQVFYQFDDLFHDNAIFSPHPKF